MDDEVVVRSVERITTRSGKVRYAVRDASNREFRERLRAELRRFESIVEKAEGCVQAVFHP